MLGGQYLLTEVYWKNIEFLFPDDYEIKEAPSWLLSIDLTTSSQKLQGKKVTLIGVTAWAIIKSKKMSNISSNRPFLFRWEKLTTNEA